VASLAQLQPLQNGLLNSSHDAIAITDADFLIRHVNPKFCELTGYRPEESIGRHIDIIRSQSLSHETALIEITRVVRSQGFWNGEFRGASKTGNKLPLSLNAIAILDDNPAENRFIFSFSASTKDAFWAPSSAHIDALTELPDRVLLIDRLQQTIAQSKRNNLLVGVILMDLDNFKAVNNRYGHPFGNRLLRQLAHRLNQILRAGDTIARVEATPGNLRPGDTIARVGGDEFVIIVTGLPNMDILENIVSRILKLTSMPCEIDGREVTVTASLGVTVFPFDAADVETLLRHADQAMYQAKEDGRNRYHLFDAERDHRAHTRRQLLERLRQALANEEFVLHYQPKLNLRTGQIIGMEALIRWQHPERGLLLPGEFLPHVEHDDLIIDIGEWVARKALKQIFAWRECGLALNVSINIAARQLLRDDFIDCLHNCLADFPDLPHGMLELEILESSAIENTAHVRHVIEICESLGIRFALDDFGTGYASLTYLKEIPAEVIKIDQSFIRHILDESDDIALVEGIIGLASAFRRIVVAEGVENAEQGVLLMRLGCDLAQGFGIARPMPAEQVPDWVAAFRPDPQWVLWADTKWEMVDFPLLVAQYDHLKWVHRVAMNVEGSSLQLTAPELSDDHQCRFGHWYYGHGSVRYGHLQEFRDLEAIHQAVHRLGPEIVQLRQSGHREEARHRLRDLLTLKDRILDKLGQLQAAVVKKS
jgi:PAS domain S-box-containing protein